MLLYAFILLIVLGLIYYELSRINKYWINKGVTQGKPLLLFGDQKDVVFKQQTFSDLVQEIYNRFPNERYTGAYQFIRPVLIIRDPELLKRITIKDFDFFGDRGLNVPEGYDTLFSHNLTFLKGEYWREMRATLSPAFTSRKMKAMFLLMSECAETFANYFIENPNENEVELRDIFSRYANDIIATCALGIKCDSLKHKNNEFYEMGVAASTHKGFSQNLGAAIYMGIPKLAKFLGITFFPKKVTEFFKNVIMNAVKLREEKKIIRPDMVHLLMEAQKGLLKYDETEEAEKETGFATVEESKIGKMKRTLKYQMSDDDLVAQALIFFFAGFDAISTIVSFMGYEIATHPDVQNKLFQEIKNVLKESKGELTYTDLNKMEYLDMVVSETLRKYNIAGFVDRQCIKDYTIPAESPNEKDLKLKKGDVIWIPIGGLHNDPKYYPNPEIFDPERFSSERRQNINPYTYLPFGIGPRNCIGNRFALLETKVVIFHILSKLELFVTKKTDIPLKIQRNGFMITTKNGLWVGIKPRN